MSLTPNNFIAPLVETTVVLFGVMAIAIYYYALKKGHIDPNDQDFFLTAKNSAPWYRIAWGFYCCTIGAGVLFAVPSFVAHPVYGGGSLGLACYAFFSGFPFLIVASMGSYIQKRFPEVLSIGSFARWRFGPIFQCWVSLNVLFNLGVALTVEYTSIGALANQFLDLPPWVPIVIVATVTIVYTAAGGLYISLVTDQIQAIFIFVLLSIIAVFVGINFRVDNLISPLPESLSVNYVGYSSIMTLGVALISSTIFSDAIWQRVWAAKTEKDLFIGAGVGMLFVSGITFLIGFGGYVAAWAGLVTEENINVAFFELVKVGTGADRAVPFVILTIILMIAFVMNESAVDSFQIAIGDTLISLFRSFGLNMGMWGSRIVLVLLNIPFAIVGCFGLNVIGLYLITNLMTTCVVVPLVLGMIPYLDTFITESSAMIGSLLGLGSIITYAFVTAAQVAGYFDGTVAWEGIVQTFYVVYDWPPFLIGLLVSTFSTLTIAALQHYYYIFKGIKRPEARHLKTEREERDRKSLLKQKSDSTVAEEPVVAILKKEKSTVSE
jgi:solute:Na+ symporter, SSS family